MPQPKHHGKFCWEELLSNDTAAAKGFYSRLMGWEAEEWPGGMPYTLFKAEGTGVGGLMALPEDAKQMGARPHWVTYVAVADADATAAEVGRLGGAVLKAPFDVPEVGRLAIVKDPQGALFAIIQPARKEAPPQPKLGAFSWRELATSDQAAAFKFYQALFGWKEMMRMPMGPDASYVIFGYDGEQRGGMYVRMSEQQPIAWLSYTAVASADSAAAAASAAGAKLINGPMDVPGGRIAQLLDPEGVMFAVHSMKAPEAKPAKATAKAAAKPAARPAAAAAKPAARPAAAAAKPAAAAPAKPAAKPVAKSAAKPVAKPAAKPAAKKGAKKPAKKAAGKGKAAKKAAKKATRKPAKKAAPRLARMADKKASKKDRKKDKKQRKKDRKAARKK
jgi:predicted enzyme related to lactoylglutathione lyase